MHSHQNVLICFSSCLLVVCFLSLAHSSQLILNLTTTKLERNGQIPLQPTFSHVNLESGLIELSQQWSAIGPFPAGMREHQLGAFPALIFHPLPTLFNITHPVQIPSTYGKAGYVQAKAIKSHIHNTGSSNRAFQTIRISYPDLDWSMTRQSKGWAGIQWQGLSVTDLRIKGCSFASLNVNLVSAAEFTIVSEEEYINYSWDNITFHTRWYNGDWYGYNREGLDEGSQVPGHGIRLKSGDYKVLVKSVYEVRIFGNMANGPPDVEFEIDISVVENSNVQAITTGQYGIAPDVVDGQLAGWGVSFVLRNNGQESVKVSNLQLIGESAKYLQGTSMSNSIIITPMQIRPIKVQVSNIESLPVDVTKIEIMVSVHSISESSTSFFEVSLPLKHRQVFSGNLSRPAPYKYTYLDVDQTVQYSIATPPRNMLARSHGQDKRPALLYLHGAGVDIRFDYAQKGILCQNETWVIQPSGRSPWGYDWQTISHLSARASLESFASNLYGVLHNVKVKLAKIDLKKTMVTGHSNGGQGAYYYSSHRPDEVIGAVMGAGYMSLAEYVPLTWQLGRHFNDAALNGILQSSLNAFENDLFASNLAGLPILIKYGSVDNNVPTWHSREMASIIQTWNHQGRALAGLLKVSEVPNRSHHWPEFMQETDVQSAFDAKLQSTLNPHFQMPSHLNHFTLTVLNPEDSGSKQGWKIAQVEVPGRIARLEVEYFDGGDRVKIRTSNIIHAQYDSQGSGTIPCLTQVDIDGTILVLSLSPRANLTMSLNLYKTGGTWSERLSSSIALRPMGPMIRFLASSGPIIAIVPTNCHSDITEHYYSIARRFSTDAYLYGRLDTMIMYDYEAIRMDYRHQLLKSNILLLGGPSINSVSLQASVLQSLVTFVNKSSQFAIRDRIFAQGTTLLALFPHLFTSERTDTIIRPMALLLHGTDPLAVERGYNLLPTRTGSLIPEWIVVDKSSIWKGYGGVLGAGWYNHDWSWSEAMGYLS